MVHVVTSSIQAHSALRYLLFQFIMFNTTVFIERLSDIRHLTKQSRLFMDCSTIKPLSWCKSKNMFIVGMAKTSAVLQSTVASHLKCFQLALFLWEIFTDVEEHTENTKNLFLGC